MLIFLSINSPNKLKQKSAFFTDAKVQVAANVMLYMYWVLNKNIIWDFLTGSYELSKKSCGTILLIVHTWIRASWLG
jgi:hypothetical protein